MSTIFLKRLKEKHPDFSLSVLCRPAHLEIFHSLPFVDRTLEYKGIGQTLPFLSAYRSATSYILPNSFSSAYLFWRARIAERIGYRSEGRCILLTKKLQFDPRWHYIRRYLGLIGEQDYDLHNTRPILQLKESSLVKFHRELEEPLRPLVVGIAPGSHAAARRWAASRFGQLARRIVQELGGSVILFGSYQDISFSTEVKEEAQVHLEDVTGKTDIGMLGQGIRKCSAFVTNESGAMHMAWAVGTPTIVIAGPSEPHATSPWGDKMRIIQRRELFCVPCVRNTCWRGGPDHKACMQKIDIETIWSELLEFVENPPREKASTS